MSLAKKFLNITSWLVFLIASIVYFYSAERVGSLWDCGEFILGAYKLQVVHPPGAPLFLLIGRMFSWVGNLSSNPENISFAVNMMSGICTAFAAMFIARITMLLGKMSFVGREGTLSKAQIYALAGAGLVSGLSTAFTASIWFSAVEGEVYAMSTMFSAMTLWASVKWYTLPDNPKSDKWLIFAVYCVGLSIGVHLLSLLILPALALFYYFKKYKKPNLVGGFAAIGVSLAMIVFIQKVVITGIPNLWKFFEIPMVNDMGLPIHSGLFPTLIILIAASYFLLKYTHKHHKRLLHLFVMGAIMATIGYSTIGVVLIRANADTPINMNAPKDIVSLIPYINREQYGERPLLYGPHFDASPYEAEYSDRYGRIGDKYEVVDQKASLKYKSKDKILFPRISHSDEMRRKLYRQWWGKNKGKPGMAFNINFFLRYQVDWMYTRYFMWNFVGKQNGNQGYYAWDKSDGNWQSGIDFIDEAKLYNMDELPETEKKNKANNSYYFLPLIFGLFGMYYQAKKSKREFITLMIVFLLTGLGIILYTNQPPNEPRERDYVLAGSFMTFCIWIGMGVLAMFQIMLDKTKIPKMSAAFVATALALSAPILMGYQNFDDIGRKDITASRDYASNFLESCAPNSILFTYGDNDTYPLWYAQEVEGIRTDIRVVNLSLIAVDWYIEKLRNKVNKSAPLKLSLSPDAYRGMKRNQVFFNPNSSNPDINLYKELAYIGNPKNEQNGQTIMRSKHLYIPIDPQKAAAVGMITAKDTAGIVPRIEINLESFSRYITKVELAVMDVIASNLYDRPIYFATTCKNDKLLQMNDYMQLEGLALRIVPFKTKSDKSISIYGSGRVADDIAYDNIMNKFKWGNFDKKDLFVDESYSAELQAHKMIMQRVAESFLDKGDYQKAIAMVDKYFEAFPDMNFAYNPYTIPLIELYIKSGELEKAKVHALILAQELEDYMVFYNSIDEETVRSSFAQNYSLDMNAIRNLMRLANAVGDPAFKKELEGKIGRYDTSRMKN